MGWGVGFQNLVCSGSPGAPSLKLSFKNLFLHPSGQVVLSKDAQQILPILEKKMPKSRKAPKWTVDSKLFITVAGSGTVGNFIVMFWLMLSGPKGTCS